MGLRLVPLCVLLLTCWACGSEKDDGAVGAKRWVGGDSCVRGLIWGLLALVFGGNQAA